MKLYIFLIILFLCVASSISGQDFIDNIKVGAKLSLPFLEAAANLKTDSFTNIPEQYNYGVSLFSDKFLKNYPCSIKYGKLSVSGSYSRINSPLLSSSLNPYMNESASVTGINASLPGSNSFSNENSLFIKLGYKNTKTLIQNGTICGIFIPSTQTFMISNYFCIAHNKNIKSLYSFSTGYFSYDENTFTSWFSNNPQYYHSGNHFCSNLQYAIHTPVIKSLFSVNLYESPYKNYNWVFENNNNLKIKNYNLSLGTVFNGNMNIVTCNQEVNNPCLQFKTGINKKYLLTLKKQQHIFLKTGFAAYTKIDLADFQNTFKFCAGSTLSSPLTTITAAATISTNPLINNNSLSVQPSAYSIQLSNCWNLKVITPTLKTSFTFTPDTEHINQKYSLNFSFIKNPKITVQNTLSIDLYSLKQEKLKETTSIKFNLSTKQITCFFYLSMFFFADS